MTERYLEIRFTYFPAELEMLPIYERLGTFKERESANVLKTLLVVVMESQAIPSWFNDIRTTPFMSHRGKTLRLRFDSHEPQYAWWVRHFTPLSVDERILSIKQMLRYSLLKLPKEDGVTTSTTLIEPPVSIPAQPVADVVPNPSPPAQPPQANSDKKRAFKGQANQYK